MITRALLENLNDIMNIENACFGSDAFSCYQIAYLITRSKGLFLIAGHNGEIAGYISFIISGRHNTGRIYSIAVSPNHRGAGIADALMNEAIGYAKEKRLRAIFLEVKIDNIAAIKLYKKKGFVVHSIKQNYYKDGTSAYSMVLR